MVDRLIQDAFVLPREGQPTTVGGAPLNVYEEDDTFVVEVQLPGFKSEDIEVTDDNGILTIRGENKTKEERKGRTYLIREHGWGTFARSIRLPDNVDPNVAQATFGDCMLWLVFPITERAKSRRIAVAAVGQPSPTAPGESSQQLDKRHNRPTSG
jgi:HSP20 family protein